MSGVQENLKNAPRSSDRAADSKGAFDLERCGLVGRWAEVAALRGRVSVDADGRACSRLRTRKPPRSEKFRLASAWWSAPSGKGERAAKAIATTLTCLGFLRWARDFLGTHWKPYGKDSLLVELSHAGSRQL